MRVRLGVEVSGLSMTMFMGEAGDESSWNYKVRLFNDPHYDLVW